MEERVNKPKIWFSEKTDKISNFVNLATLTKEKMKTQTINIKNEETLLLILQGGKWL